MRIEDQVCPLEQAKELVGLGLSIKTYWFWLAQFSHNTNKPSPTQSPNFKYYNLIDHNTLHQIKQFTSEVEFYPAPTCSELGVLLSGYQIILTPNDGWEVFDPDGFAHGFLAEYCDKLPETAARAEALIWLIDEKYIDPKDLKL